MPRCSEEVTDVAQIAPEERTAEQIVDILVAQQSGEAAQIMPQERVQNHTVKHNVDVPIPHCMDIANVVEVVPHECVQNRAVIAKGVESKPPALRAQTVRAS